METVNTFILGGRVVVKQPARGGLRVTMDTVFVAAACPARPGQRVADFGAGTGAAGLCVARRVGDVRVAFVEIQPDFLALCRDNAVANEVEADALCADIRTHKGQYDHIVCNPPYQDEAAHEHSPDDARQTAVGIRAGEATLADWIAAAARCLKARGTLSIIHRADALAGILTALNDKPFGAIEIWPLQPYADGDASRVIVRAVKGRKTPLRLHPAIVLHNEIEKYSAAAQRVLTAGEALGQIG